MQKNITWSGVNNLSVENCVITINDNLGTKTRGTIMGIKSGAMFKVDYSITTNGDWQTLGFEIKAQLDSKINFIKFDSNGNGKWTVNGKPLPEFEGCIDIDISLTPFTNTLPINRLGLQPGDKKMVRVLYIDILKQDLLPVEQIYTCISATEYKFESLDNDFEAMLTIDEIGLVNNYPELFTLKMKEETNYPI